MSVSNLEDNLDQDYDFAKFKKFETDKLLSDMEGISEEKKLEVYFKDNLNSMLESISSTRKIVLAQKMKVEELKTLLKEKTAETKKAVWNAEKSTSRKNELLQKAEQTRKDLETTIIAIDNIENATKTLSQDEASIAKESLKPVLVKKTAISEKAEVELKAAEQIEIEANKKAKKLERELTQLEDEYNKKLEEANNSASNMATTINHVVTSFRELTDIAKNLLESSVSTKISEDTQYSNADDNTVALF